jgi:hypothetical protein
MTLVALAVVSFASWQDPDSLPLLGTNLAPIEARTTQWPFIDATRVAGAWASQDGTPVEIDPAGNVVRLAPGQVAVLRLFTDGNNPVGDYTLTWSGDADFEAGSEAELKVQNEGSAVLTVSSAAGIMLRLTRMSPSDPPRNVKLWMPGQRQNEGSSPHHPVFLQRMGLYRVLRFADWTRAGADGQVDWTTRATTSDATYTLKGVPYEVLFDLCREKNVIPWLCVPLKADDSYVRELAKLAASRLDSKSRLILEHGDETWQSAEAQEQGTALGLSDDPRTAGLRYSAKRAAAVFSIFEEEFGGKSRLVRVWSGPIDDPEALEETLDWEDTARKVDALSVRAHFGQDLGNGPGPADLDALFSGLREEIETKRRAEVREAVRVARRMRVLLVSHRSGQSLVASDPDDEALNRLFDEANRDERMSEAYVRFYRMWRDEGASLAMHASDCSPLRREGRWGALEHQAQDSQTAPKHKGLMEYSLFTR